MSMAPWVASFSLSNSLSDNMRANDIHVHNVYIHTYMHIHIYIYI